MARDAYALSEAWDLPILIRTVTRLAHSKRMVEVDPKGDAPLFEYTTRPEKYVMMPSNARGRRADLDRRLGLALAVAEEEGRYNRLEWRERELGVITSAVVYTHVREALPEASVLKLGLSWPLPEDLIRTFAEGVKGLAIVEELDTWLEKDVRAMGLEVIDLDRPMMGPLDALAVRTAFGGPACADGPTVEADLPGRPPMLCPGCPHRAVFYALHKKKAIVMGDIGCYTLGALPPLSAMDITLCMGASVGAAHGFVQAGAGTDRPVCAVPHHSDDGSTAQPCKRRAHNGGSRLGHRLREAR
jgi:indolepyruvate ferredoxin oxidoreductase alpha subunit